MTLSHDKYLFIENIYKTIKNLELNDPVIIIYESDAFLNIQSDFNSFFDTLLICKCETCNKKLNIMIYGFGENQVIQDIMSKYYCIFCKDQFIKENQVILDQINPAKRSRFN